MRGLNKETVSPTPELVAKIGKERWQPALVNQQVRRPYCRRTPALDHIAARSNLNADAVSALSQLATFLAGAARARGLVSSYGEQRWSGTTAGQEVGSIITEEWPIYCAQRVRQAEKHIDCKDEWDALVLVLRDDLLFIEAGYRMGARTDEGARKKASRAFYSAIPKMIHVSDRIWD